MSSRSAFPPTKHHPHLTVRLTTADAQPRLATYLEKSRKAPWMHPDAWLASEGVRHGPKSGPSGGWAIHHLRRIEAGLRGENLDPESKEELVAKFGEEVVGHGEVGAAQLQAGDDTRVDALISERGSTDAGPLLDEKAERKRKKKQRKERERAEREAAEQSSKPSKKRKLNSDTELSDAGTGANTPYADSMVAYSENQWQRKEDYEQSQPILEGELGERDGAPVVKQSGTPPVVVQHDEEGEVEVPKKARTKEDKAARKAAKRARREEKKAAKAKG